MIKSNKYPSTLTFEFIRLAGFNYKQFQVSNKYVSNKYFNQVYFKLNLVYRIFWYVSGRQRAGYDFYFLSGDRG